MMRRLTRQELQAKSRDVEQRGLAGDAGMCPDDGLCNWCLECLAEEYETGLQYGDYSHDAYSEDLW